MYRPTLKCHVLESKDGLYSRTACDAEDAKVMRRLHRAERGPELDRGNRTIHSMTPQSGEEHFNAAFVRAVSRSGVPRLTVFCRPTLQGSDLAHAQAGEWMLQEGCGGRRIPASTGSS